MTGWKEIWSRRQPDESNNTTLARLITSDGFDQAFGGIREQAWVDFVRRFADTLGLQPGNSVFDVGCGAGAFLYDLYAKGINVGGIDISPGLIKTAKQVMPKGTFDVCDAAGLDTSDRFDAVISFGAFLYFDSLDYARQVIELMAAKAHMAVAVLELPDAAKRESAIRFRQAAAGGRQAYEDRYRGLDHLYFDKDWVLQAFADCGLLDVRIEDQEINGYPNAPFRFNAFGFKQS